jgi:uncharacterized YigZ family protein
MFLTIIWSCYVSPLVVRPVARRHNTFVRRMASTEAMTTLDAGSHQSELIVKKSQFIGYAKHVENWKDAQEFLDVIRAEHPKARHVCFGFVAGVNPVQERCSDDGEPTGTAGAPILGAIKGEGLSDSICVVVRYFGGIKLGAGGLIRAYGGGARQVLREAPKKTLIPKSTIRISVPSSFIGSVYDTASKAGGVTFDDAYDAHGNLAVSITVPTEHEQLLIETLTDATRGEVEFLQDQ